MEGERKAAFSRLRRFWCQGGGQGGGVEACKGGGRGGRSCRRHGHQRCLSILLSFVPGPVPVRGFQEEDEGASSLFFFLFFFCSENENEASVLYFGVGSLDWLAGQ